MPNKESYSWFKIESLDLAIGNLTTIKAGKKDICLAHIKDGFYAVGNRCPHASGSLGSGYIDTKGNVVCPLHRYKFDLKTGKNNSGEGYYVKTYPIKEEKGDLYVGVPNRKFRIF